MWQELQPDDPRQIGPYRLRGQLGVGGMGRVFLGLSADERPVAVKVVRLDLAADPEFRTRFRREVAVARRVSGKFTAPVIDADLDSPTPWLATAYVAGPSLADAVAEHGPLPPAKVLELATGLAEGLSAIHAAGVVHRDLKPSNVLLAPDGPRLIDFGISRAVEASALTHTGMVVGSPGFMSPEQAEGREVGTPSDIFSLGAVLAFAATGAGPFGAGSTPALVYRVVYSPPSLDRVPAEVRPLIERCLDKDPARRPAARDLLAQTGAAPGAGWLPDAVTRTFLQQPAGQAAVPTAPGRRVMAEADRTPTEPVARLALAGGQASARRQHRQRRRLGQPAAVAALVAGLLAASAAGGLALTNYSHQPSSAHVGQVGSAAQVQSTGAPVTSTPAAAYPSTAASPAAAYPSTAASPAAAYPSTAATSPAAPGTSSPGTTPASTPPSADPWASGSPAPTASPTAATGSY